MRPSGQAEENIQTGPFVKCKLWLDDKELLYYNPIVN